MRPTALLGLNVVTEALTGVKSGTASIEATKETGGLGMKNPNREEKTDETN